MKNISPKTISPLLLSSLVFVIIAGGLVFFLNKQTETSPIVTTSPSPSSSPTPSPSSSVNTSPTPLSGTTIIYHEQTGTISTAKREIPVYNVYSKTGSEAPVLLMTAGKEGEFPDQFLLSPDHKTLIVNLENKIQKLDIATKKLTDVLTAKKEFYYNVIFSPDGAQLLAWDQFYSSDTDHQYSIHKIDLATGKDSVIKSGTSDIYYSLMTWRKDNSVVLSVPQGEFSDMAFYNLGTGEITKNEHTAYPGLLSQTGKILAQTASTVSDVCNGFSGDAESSHKIIDLGTEKTLTTVGDATKAVRILGFSPDDSQVLYAEWTPAKSEAECSTTPSKSYYLASAAKASTPERLASPSTTLLSWGLPAASVVNSNDNATHSIIQDKDTLVSSAHELSLIAQY